MASCTAAMRQAPGPLLKCCCSRAGSGVSPAMPGVHRIGRVLFLAGPSPNRRHHFSPFDPSTPETAVTTWLCQEPPDWRQFSPEAPVATKRKNPGKLRRRASGNGTPDHHASCTGADRCRLVAWLLIRSVRGNQAHNDRNNHNDCNDDNQSHHVHDESAPCSEAGARPAGEQIQGWGRARSPTSIMHPRRQCLQSGTATAAAGAPVPLRSKKIPRRSGASQWNSATTPTGDGVIHRGALHSTTAQRRQVSWTRTATRSSWTSMSERRP